VVPGEQLPRWSLTCFWRKDGEPIWNNPDLIADASAPAPGGTRHLPRRRAARLAVDRARSSRPTKTPSTTCGASAACRATSTLRRPPRRPLERDRIRRVYEHGLPNPVGYVLPISLNAYTGAWQTGPWFLRDERCYLIPGDRRWATACRWIPSPGSRRLPYVNPPTATSLPPLPASAIRRQLPRRPDRCSTP
jgi:uncharacterized protein (DUF2126 family)